MNAFDRLRYALVIVFTTVWVVSFMADLFIREYDAPPIVHLLMMGVAGFMFGPEVEKWRKRRNGD